MQPTKTRWNSIANMATSILQMKDAFDAIRQASEPAAKTLRAAIPTEEEFTLLQCLDPLLQIVRIYCMTVEEDTPKIHRFLVGIHNLRGEVKKLMKMATKREGVFEKLDRDHQKEVIELMQHFVSVFYDRLQKYDSSEYTFSAVLNPHYKGVPLFKLQAYQETITSMISGHESTWEHRQQTPRASTTQAGLASLSEDQIKAMSACDRENYERLREIERRKANSNYSPSDPPLKLEILRYEEMDSAESDEDALNWWKKKKNELPLLAAMARNYLCIQVTSSASERVFSTGGRIVNKLRSGLSHETTAKLVYMEQNSKYVPDSVFKWKLEHKVTYQPTKNVTKNQ